MAPHLFHFSDHVSVPPLRGGLSVPSCEGYDSNSAIIITLLRCDTGQLIFHQKWGLFCFASWETCTGATHCHIRISLLEAFRFRRQNWPLHVDGLVMWLHKQTEVSGLPQPLLYDSESTSDSIRGALYRAEGVWAPNQQMYEQNVIVIVGCYIWDTFFRAATINWNILEILEVSIWENLMNEFNSNLDFSE